MKCEIIIGIEFLEMGVRETATLIPDTHNYRTFSPSVASMKYTIFVLILKQILFMA